MQAPGGDIDEVRDYRLSMKETLEQSDRLLA